MKPKTDGPELLKVYSQTPLVDTDFWVVYFCNQLYNLNTSDIKQLGLQLVMNMFARLDNTAPKQLRFPGAAYNFSPEIGQRLALISPYSPQAIVQLLTTSVNQSPADLTQWEADYKRFPAVIRAMAKYYTARSQFDDAERCLKHLLSESPNVDLLVLLGQPSIRSRNEDKWRETLEESLKYEANPLHHAWTRVKLADRYMQLRQWDKALPLAAAAAETVASWAWNASADCHEALEHWEESEALTRMNAENYQVRSCDWYFWCRRNERGDLKAAKDLCVKRIDLLDKNPSPQGHASKGFGVFADGSRRVSGSRLNGANENQTIRSTGCIGYCFGTRSARSNL